MFKEFKEFAMRGNVLDLAIGIIIGGAFGKIVSSLVGDILMPPLGMVLGKVDFTNLFLSLDGKVYASLTAAQEAGAATLNYGIFINSMINFIFVAFAVFILVRGINRLKRKEAVPEPAAPTTKDCPFCCSAIPLAATRCSQCTSNLEN